MRDWTKATWTWVITTPLGAAAIFWFGALLQTKLFSGVSSPSTRGGSWLLLSVIGAAVVGVAVGAVGISGARDRQHRWIFTKTQVARAEAEDAVRQEANTRRRIQETLLGIHAANLAHGDTGVVAYILGVPVEDVLKVTSQQGEEEPPIPEHDLGPEIDDAGGMSEVPELPDGSA